MGLDMYLNKDIYIPSYNGKDNIDLKINGNLPDCINPEKINTIQEEFAYWRKANHIHKWFVENVQNGNDDCGSYHVTDDQLQELLDLCKQVKEDPDKAPELLPTTSGFFFGGEEYDEWYFQSIDYTIEKLEDALSGKYQHDGLWISFEYRSSW